MNRLRIFLPALALAAILPFQQGAAPLPVPQDVDAFLEYGFQGEGTARVQDIDIRGDVAPSEARRAAAQALGATVRWNRFGTPQVITGNGQWLSAPASGEPADVARAWVRAHRDLFGLSGAAVADLAVVQDSPMYESPDWARQSIGLDPAATRVPHVIRFEQRLAGLRPFQDGQLVVGVGRDGAIAFVSSSVTPSSEVVGSRVLTPTQAVLTAAADVGFAVGDLSVVAGTASATGRDFIELESSLVPDVQRVRPAFLPIPGGASRQVWEVTLLDSRADADGYGNPIAFISFVDAQSGKVWTRSNQVQHQEAPEPGEPSAEAFEGVVPGGPAGTCGEDHVFTVGEGNGTITVSATSPTPEPNGVLGAGEPGTGDLTIKLSYDGEVVAAQDLLQSPEVLTYSPSGGIEPGDYTVNICRFNSGDVILAYFGTFQAQAGASADFTPPKWRSFFGNPNLADSRNPSADVRSLLCWGVQDGDPFGCDVDVSNIASRVPWDVQAGQAPTQTTDGNNASTAISNASFLTPDTAAQRPTAADRNYDFPWANTWFEESCDPSVYATPGGNDDDASVTNLFVGHNRMHDWSYMLGFTEVNSTLQVSNFGNTSADRETDPELGSAQAGRATPNGRDNANQISLQDGVPGVTNQYLWQPLASAFYSPCVDGAFDFSVYGHEYTHAISNRMTGGPDGSLSSFQADSMGESWSDLAAIEIQLEYGVAPPGLEWVIGAYATGDGKAGIRNYPLDQNPLHYGDIGYDTTGAEFHADGEIWNGVQYEVRRELVAKWDAVYSSKNAELQERCARGERASDTCPGNRRWIQLLFDGFLLQPSETSMLDSRDAILAADLMRYDGENQEVLWRAFSRFGMGVKAATDGGEDQSPHADFQTPYGGNGTVRFTTSDLGQGVPNNLEVYVGRFEARIDPVADTSGETGLKDTVRFAPGTYEMLARADGYGATRFKILVEPNADATVAIPMRRNLASVHSAAEVTGDGVNLEGLVDDTEATNWASTDGDGTASEGKGEGRQVEGRQVTVELFQPATLNDIQVSAMTRPGCEPDTLTGECDPDDETGEPDPDPGSQNRFTQLRSFDILTCDASTGANCDAGQGFTKAYASPDDAFPAVKPRPRVPQANLRGFDMPDTRATHVRLVVRDNQCTGAPGYQGEANPDNDPSNDPDCDANSSNAEVVRAAELQVFAGQARDPLASGTGVTIITREVTRLAGATRYGTAAEISADAFPTPGSAPVVVLARGDDPNGFADALAGTPLAADLGAPLLLTSPSELPAETEAELVRVLPRGRTVVVLGGEAAVAPSVANRLKDLGYSVRRVFGGDRYETAVAIAGELGNPGTVLLATGTNWPDGLAAGAAAVESGAAVLLTGDSTPAAATTAYLAKASPSTVWAIGGPAARAYPTAKGLVGASRVETAIQVATTFFPSPDVIGLSRSDRFPDALAGGLHVAMRGGPVLLTSTDELVGPVASYICAVGSGTSGGYVYGGTVALTEAVRTAFEVRLNGGRC